MGMFLDNPALRSYLSRMADALSGADGAAGQDQNYDTGSTGGGMYSAGGGGYQYESGAPEYTGGGGGGYQGDLTGGVDSPGAPAAQTPAAQMPATPAAPPNTSIPLTVRPAAERAPLAGEAQGPSSGGLISMANPALKRSPSLVDLGMPKVVVNGQYR